MCPIRCTWNRTWSSNTTPRTDPSSVDGRKFRKAPPRETGRRFCCRPDVRCAGNGSARGADARAEGLRAGRSGQDGAPDVGQQYNDAHCARRGQRGPPPAETPGPSGPTGRAGPLRPPGRDRGRVLIEDHGRRKQEQHDPAGHLERVPPDPQCLDQKLAEQQEDRQPPARTGAARIAVYRGSAAVKVAMTAARTGTVPIGSMPPTASRRARTRGPNGSRPVAKLDPVSISRLQRVSQGQRGASRPGPRRVVAAGLQRVWPWPLGPRIWGARGAPSRCRCRSPLERRRRMQ